MANTQTIEHIYVVTRYHIEQFEIFIFESMESNYLSSGGKYMY